MFDDLVTYKKPPLNRSRFCSGDEEHHLSEGAVMLAFAMHLLRTIKDLKEVSIHPDGEHGKTFDFRSWLEKRGFKMTQSIGSTPYGGRYASVDGRTIVVNPKSGQGDVVAHIGEQSYIAECKGGCINTRHPGQQSRLRKGLSETVGLSLASPMVKGRTQFAVAPRTRTTELFAKRMAPRARNAGVHIALVDIDGSVTDVHPEQVEP